MHIFKPEHLKTIVIFEIGSLKFAYHQNFMKKQNCLNLDPKNALFWYFWARILKNYCHISNQHSQIWQRAKLRENAKMPKFGSKQNLFGYFWPRIWKSYC